MIDMEGYVIKTIPATHYKSCTECEHYDIWDMGAGCASYYCRHSDAPKPFLGNLMGDTTPEWCPCPVEQNSLANDEYILSSIERGALTKLAEDTGTKLPSKKRF